MDENKEIEIDFKKIFEMIKQKLVYIILITVIGAVASGCITNFFITPQYTASIQLYAWSNSEHIVTPSSNITPNEIEASQMLINSYLVAIQSDTFIEKVADQVEGNITPTQIKKMLSCSAIEETNIFKVSITSTDPKQAAEIANVIADVCPDEIVRIMKVGGVEIVDYAKEPTKPSSPNTKKNILIGAAAGFILSFAFFFLKDMFDTSINDENDLKREFDIPIIGTIPKLLPVTEKSKANAESEFLIPPQPSVIDHTITEKEGN